MTLRHWFLYFSTLLFGIPIMADVLAGNGPFTFISRAIGMGLAAGKFLGG